LSHTDSLNKNSQQIAIAKTFTNSFRYTMVFGKLPKNSCNTGGAGLIKLNLLFNQKITVEQKKT